MTALTLYDFGERLTGTHQAHLEACREAWRQAVLAYGTMGEADGDRLTAIIHRLAILTNLPEAGLRAAQAYWALKPYPLPVAPNAAAENAMWDLFFLLVLAVQSDDAERMYVYSEQLALLVAGTGIHSRWWLKRARAYAPLGLTLATRV